MTNGLVNSRVAIGRRAGNTGMKMSTSSVTRMENSGKLCMHIAGKNEHSFYIYFTALVGQWDDELKLLNHNMVKFVYVLDLA